MIILFLFNQISSFFMPNTPLDFSKTDAQKSRISTIFFLALVKTSRLMNYAADLAAEKTKEQNY